MQMVVVDTDGEFLYVVHRIVGLLISVYICLSAVEDEEEAVSSTAFSVNFTSL